MLTSIARLWQIRQVAKKYGLGELAGEQAPRWLLGRPKDFEQPIGVRLREALTELGPVFIKFGQTLSTRRDLLPPELVDELALLQDHVPPFAGSVARELIEQGLGQPIDALFENFNDTPLAAASIAQVHTARLKPSADQDHGPEVVVKVLRPDVHKKIIRDVNVLYQLARWACRLIPRAKRLRPIEVVAEYERIITDELDLLREAGNASQLRRNWLDSGLIDHPEVYFDYSCESVLVMQRVHGIPIDDLVALREAGVSFKALAERGVEIFFKQVFRDNFFHADMHPGNIFVDPEDPKNPRYIGIDFGIVGTLTLQDQRYLAENFLAFFNRDYRRIAELHIESGWMPQDTRIEEFEGAIRTVSEPIFNKPLAEISFGIFMIRLFRVAQRYNYQIQPQLVLLQKTILNVEGLGRELYPQLDLWATAKPILEEWMHRRASLKIATKSTYDNLPEMIEGLPKLTLSLFRRLESGINPASQHLENHLAAELRKNRKVGRWNVLGVGLLTGSIVGGFAADQWLFLPLIGVIAGALCCGLAWRIDRRLSA